MTAVFAPVSTRMHKYVLALQIVIAFTASSLNSGENIDDIDRISKKNDLTFFLTIAFFLSKTIPIFDVRWR